MAFPNQKKGTTPAVPKKAPQVLEDGRLRGCQIARGPETVTVDGRPVELTVQVTQPTTSGTRINNEAALVRLARSALVRPGGVKQLAGGLIRITARHVD